MSIVQYDAFMQYSVSPASLMTAILGGLVLSFSFLPSFLSTDIGMTAGTVFAAEVITSTSSPALLPAVALEQSDVHALVPQYATGPIYPAHLSIPSVGINSPVVAVGKNSKGEMDVPSGTSNNLGWYKYGTKPGDRGMAVFDAHVFAALRNLRYAKIGDDVYVTGTNGAQLHFRITESMLYKLSELTPQMLFGSRGGREINIITCAGTYISSWGTYDHRLVVTAALVD